MRKGRRKKEKEIGQKARYIRGGGIGKEKVKERDERGEAEQGKKGR